MTTKYKTTEHYVRTVEYNAIAQFCLTEKKRVRVRQRQKKSETDGKMEQTLIKASNGKVSNLPIHLLSLNDDDMRKN